MAIYQVLYTMSAQSSYTNYIIKASYSIFFQKIAHQLTKLCKLWNFNHVIALASGDIYLNSICFGTFCKNYRVIGFRTVTRYKTDKINGILTLVVIESINCCAEYEMTWQTCAVFYYKITQTSNGIWITCYVPCKYEN